MNCRNCNIPLTPCVRACQVCGYPVQDGASNIRQQQPVSSNVWSFNQTTPPGTLQAPFQLPRQTPKRAQQPQPQGKLLPLHLPTRLPKLLTFLYRVRCPYCNAEFHPSDCAIYADYLDNQGQWKRKLVQEAPGEGIGRTLARFRIKSLSGSYTQQDARRACPTCQKLLPRGFEITPTFTIAVIGDTLSGKSHFLTTLLHQLKEEVAVDQDTVIFRFRPLGDDVSTRFKKFEQIVFNEHRTLPLTTFHTQASGTNTVEWEPLIFSLEIGYKVDGVFRSIVINLVFYDIAGEDITQETNLKHFGWPILQAHAIIHVTDPLGMSNILDRLPANDQIQKAKAMLQKRPKTDEVLAKVIRICTEYKEDNVLEGVKTPTAIMLSKSDVLDPIVQQMPLQSTRFLQPPKYNGRVNLDEMSAIDTEVKQLLAIVGEHGLLRESERFTTIQFFAASATGSAPDQNNRFPKVEPRRCLDPLFWLLWQLMSVGNK